MDSLCHVRLFNSVFYVTVPSHLQWSAELQEGLVCSFLNGLSIYSDLPLLRPEKGLQAKTLIR